MREIVYQQSVDYDPLKDRSEEMGWSRVDDEVTLKQAELLLWSKIFVAFAILLAGLGLLLS